MGFRRKQSLMLIPFIFKGQSMRGINTISKNRQRKKTFLFIFRVQGRCVMTCKLIQGMQLVHMFTLSNSNLNMIKMQVHLTMAVFLLTGERILLYPWKHIPSNYRPVSLQGFGTYYSQQDHAALRSI